MSTTSIGATRPTVAIVGGGFGGIAAARALRRVPVDVVVTDRHNHHLFQPLLYQVATAALSPADIAWPIRRILGRQENARVLMADVTGVDVERRRLVLGSRELAWDYLVLACGTRHAYFGHDDWEPYAPGLKGLADATGIRRRILLALERAELEDDPEIRRRLLTFVVVGGGPTGVEMAGAISELVRHAARPDFRRIRDEPVRICLVEAGDTLLAPYPDALRRYTLRALEKLGVEVRLNEAVTDCGADGVTLGDTAVAAATVIWAAGNAASPAGGWLTAERDRAGRVRVGKTLETEKGSNVFVIGDMAHFAGEDGNPLPGVAAVAKQQGRYTGEVIARRIAGRDDPPPFRYRDVGMLATIGRRAAVADLGRVRLRGRLAWWFWGFVHIYFLINARSRATVAVQWFWSYLTFDRSARLIVTQDDGPPSPG